jgi:CheY-like chemotaxis protein
MVKFHGFMKVLVAHRQESVVENIKAHLPQCIVTCSKHGTTALSFIRTKRYDLVISGCDLPGVTGFELVRNLRDAGLNHSTSAILLAEGDVPYQHWHLAKCLGAVMLTVEEVKRLKNMELWLN